MQRIIIRNEVISKGKFSDLLQGSQKLNCLKIERRQNFEHYLSIYIHSPWSLDFLKVCIYSKSPQSVRKTKNTGKVAYCLFLLMYLWVRKLQANFLQSYWRTCRQHTPKNTKITRKLQNLKLWWQISL